MTEETATPDSAKTAAESENQTAPAAEAQETEQAQAAKKPATRTRRATTKTATAENTENKDASEEGVAKAEEAAPEKPKTRRASTKKAEEPAAEPAAADAEKEEKASSTASRATRASSKKEDEAAAAEKTEDKKAEKKSPVRRTRKTQAAEPKASDDHVSLDADSSKSAAMDAVAELMAQTTPKATTTSKQKQEAIEELEQVVDEELENSDNNRRSKNRNQQKNKGRGKSDGDNSDSDDNEEGQDNRSSRNRQRDRKRRGGSDDVDPEILEDDVLIPIAGILDVLDNYAFVRTTGYLSGSSDIYVSLGQVKKYQLRKGDAIIGAIRQPREGENTGRQKYNALVKIDTINGIAPDAQQTRADFSATEAIAPVERLRLETDKDKLSTRMIDILAPIGKGQRGLILGSAASGKTTLVKNIAEAISVNHPEVHLMVALIDARPEEVTDFKRTVKGEIIAHDIDSSLEDQISLAELAAERAKRLVELGHDVVLLIDSLSRLAKTQHSISHASNRVISDSFDAAAIQGVKRLFASAKKDEQAGSFTIIGTVIEGEVDSFDNKLVSEFAQLANSEIHVDGLSMVLENRLSIDPFLTGTRNVHQFISQDEATVLAKLAHAARQNPQTAEEVITGMVKETNNNVELLMDVQRATLEELVSKFDV